MAYTIIQQAIASNFRNIMAQQITITPQTSTADVLSALITLCGMLVHRTVNNASAALKTAKIWLYSQHAYFGQDGDPIEATGWQFLGMGALTVVVSLFLCIDWDATL